MKVVGWVLVAVIGLLGLVSLDPAVVGLSETTPVLQAIAMRGLLGGGIAAGGLALLLLALVLRRTAGRGRRCLTLGLVAVLVGAGHVGVLLERGTDLGEPFGTKPDGAVDVLTLNTLGMAAGAEVIATLVDRTAPDVVALQETPAADAEQVAALVATGYQVFTDTTGPDPVQGTALLVADHLGPYQQRPAPPTTFGGVWAEPVRGDGPQLLSVHPVPPVPQNVGTWKAELEALLGLCARVPGIVMAGDLNATVDHAVVRRAACVDSSVGVGGVGTWPAGPSPFFGAAIDHVMADPQSWQAAAARVLEIGDGDHRAVLVRLVPAD